MSIFRIIRSAHWTAAATIASVLGLELLALLLCTLSALAQDKPASPHKVVPAPKFYPVSKYVRKIGVLCLETIDDFEKHCDGPMSDAAIQKDCAAAMVNWESTFDQLEHRVDIELSDSKSIGDLGTWELLKEAQVTKRMYLAGFRLNGDKGKAIMETWVPAMSRCRSYANFAVFGVSSDDTETYSGDGGCAELIQKALNSKSAPQTVAAELRAKCAPFADGSADKVLAKTMPLPPKECREALGWMRDTRLNALYARRVSTTLIHMIPEFTEV